MNKCISLLLGLFLCLGGISYAADKEVVFEWDKTTIEQDLAGFKIYEYDSNGVPTGGTFTIPYVVGVNDFVYETIIVVPEGQVTTMCYAISAFDFSGNESLKTVITEDSCITVDFEPPSGCTNFKVRIKIND